MRFCAGIAANWPKSSHVNDQRAASVDVLVTHLYEPLLSIPAIINSHNTSFIFCYTVYLSCIISWAPQVYRIRFQPPQVLKVVTNIITTNHSIGSSIWNRSPPYPIRNSSSRPWAGSKERGKEGPIIRKKARAKNTRGDEGTKNRAGPIWALSIRNPSHQVCAKALRQMAFNPRQEKAKTGGLWLWTLSIADL